MTPVMSAWSAEFGTSETVYAVSAEPSTTLMNDAVNANMNSAKNARQARGD